MHAHAHTRSTKSWIDDDIPTAFFLLFLLFFPARQKSITEANLCYPRTPHSTHPIIPNGLSRRRWGLFLDFASNINYRKYLRGYRTTSCSRASDKASWIEVLFWVFVRVFSHRKGQSFNWKDLWLEKLPARWALKVGDTQGRTKGDSLFIYLAETSSQTVFKKRCRHAFSAHCLQTLTLMLKAR